MERILIQLPASLKAKLDALRSEGYTASGFIRSVLEREMKERSRKVSGLCRPFVSVPTKKDV